MNAQDNKSKRIHEWLLGTKTSVHVSAFVMPDGYKLNTILIRESQIDNTIGFMREIKSYWAEQVPYSIITLVYLYELGEAISGGAGHNEDDQDCQIAVQVHDAIGKLYSEDEIKSLLNILEL